MPSLHRSRVYADVNAHRSEDNADVNQYKIKWIKTNFVIEELLGKGTFGEVYQCKDAIRGRTFALKVLLRANKHYTIKQELMILESLQGSPNIIKLFGAVKNSSVGGPAIVFKYMDPDGYAEMAESAKSEDIRFYMFELLKALEACHSKGIMHRDVKPENILIDTRRRELRLIDFGHADYYYPNKEYSVQVCTRHYKGPELLVNYKKYDYSLDLWSFGCILAGLIFKCEVFFDGKSNDDQLIKIIKVMGTNDLLEYLNKYDIVVIEHLKHLETNDACVPLEIFVSESNRNTATPLALDLLKRLLKYDHRERLTAKEAMSHSYFHESDSSSKKF
ncbi:hypothetical protein Aperf_G00000016210 [Anoplocephala perfoliata]